MNAGESNHSARSSEECTVIDARLYPYRYRSGPRWKYPYPWKLDTWRLHVDPRSRYQQLPKIIGNAERGKQFPNVIDTLHTIDRLIFFECSKAFRLRAIYLLSVLKVLGSWKNFLYSQLCVFAAQFREINPIYLSRIIFIFVFPHQIYKSWKLNSFYSNLDEFPIFRSSCLFLATLQFFALKYTIQK